MSCNNYILAALPLGRNCCIHCLGCRPGRNASLEFFGKKIAFSAGTRTPCIPALSLCNVSPNLLVYLAFKRRIWNLANDLQNNLWNRTYVSSFGSFSNRKLPSERKRQKKRKGKKRKINIILIIIISFTNFNA